MNKFEWVFFLVFMIIGLLPAFIARRKGRDFLTWWVFGDLFFLVALPAALTLKPGNPDIEEHQHWQSEDKECPFCGGVLSRAIDRCTYCTQPTL